MQLIKPVSNQQSAVSRQRQLCLTPHASRLAAFMLIAHFSFLIAEAGAEDKFSVKYQHYEDDRSISYKDTKGVSSDRWLMAIAKTITEKTSLSMNYGVDAISSASWKIDAVTSASRRAGREDRYSGSLGMNHAIGRTNLSAGFGLSRENNYNSDHAYASIAQDFNKRNTTIALTGSRVWDQVYSVKIGDSRTFPKPKDTAIVGLSLTQNLAPWTVMAVGQEYATIDGYQAHPEHSVLLSNGSYSEEVHPGSRFRNASVIMANQYLPWSGAVHADYRYYHDSWGIGSNTIGLKYYQYLFDDLFIRLGLRYYSQGAADFYSDNPSPSDTYPTIDGKLRRFDSGMYGMKLVYNATKHARKMMVGFAEKVSLDIKYDRYWQTDAITSATKLGSPTGGAAGLQADIVQMGLGMEF